jgi:hypothetical protein
VRAGAGSIVRSRGGGESFGYIRSSNRTGVGVEEMDGQVIPLRSRENGAVSSLKLIMRG